MSDLKTLEHSTLVVPYEYLNKKFRIAQKTIEREFSKVGNVVNELEQILSKPMVKVDEMNGTVNNLLEKLTSLKRKASEVVEEENAATNLLKKRLSYLKIPCDPKISNNQLQQWNEERVDRVIVEHLLRTGHYEIAKILAENKNLEYIVVISDS
uniref:LisH domain-containing protein n=1 Tax=Romanomermis culicivorax TaxID=13658 RepID=A0A915KWD7_ROMCU